MIWKKKSACEPHHQRGSQHGKGVICYWLPRPDHSVVLACGCGFIWLSHVIWGRTVEDCSLKQHTPPCTLSSHQAHWRIVCIGVALCCMHPKHSNIYWHALWWPQRWEWKFRNDHFHSSKFKNISWNANKWSHMRRKERERKREWTWNEEHIFSCTAVKGVGVGSGSKTNTHSLSGVSVYMCVVVYGVCGEWQHGARLTELYSLFWEFHSV